MLDIKLIRENPELVKQGLQKKGFSPELVDTVLSLDEQKRTEQFASEQLRAQQKKLDFTDESTRDRAKSLKEELQTREEQLREIDTQFATAMMDIPNIPQEDVPVGEGESANMVLRTVGEKPAIANPVDHVTIGEKHDLFDIDRATKVAGSRFNYLKNQAVILEFALVRFAFDLAMKHGHTPMITPELVNEKTVTGTGYLPHGADEVYKTQDDLYLIGTSELALVAYHQDEILAENELPKRYVGFSSCFRREAGTYGKDTRGILRQHQFDKVELVSFVKPEDSAAELDRILGIEEELMQALKLPYHILEIGTGDLGIQAAKKYDIETWLPGQDKYRETHSCSNTTDFQTRRLNIRYKKADGTNEFAHSLNGTAVAVGRMLIAILENGQQADGSVVIPEALQPYTGFDTIG
jgi:seryl-tRNA synthetase